MPSWLLLPIDDFSWYDHYFVQKRPQQRSYF
jgi:hypothetical protein